MMRINREQLSVKQGFLIIFPVHNGLRVASGSAQTSSTRWRVESAQSQVEQEFQTDTSRNRGVRCAKSSQLPREFRVRCGSVNGVLNVGDRWIRKRARAPLPALHFTPARWGFAVQSEQTKGQEPFPVPALKRCQNSSSIAPCTVWTTRAARCAGMAP